MKRTNTTFLALALNRTKNSQVISQRCSIVFVLESFSVNVTFARRNRVYSTPNKTVTLTV